MRGHTLIELLFVLTLFGVTTTSLAPTVRRYRDRSAVVAAREALVGLLAETRLAAREMGKASLHLASSPATARSAVGDSTIRAVPLTMDFGVSVTLSGGRPEAELRFGALGLGRLAGQTIDIRRGEASAQLIVSSYGRVRRR
jgi:type II secretory pathway pseudopilin PulG